MKVFSWGLKFTAVWPYFAKLPHLRTGDENKAVSLILVLETVFMSDKFLLVWISKKEQSRWICFSFFFFFNFSREEIWRDVTQQGPDLVSWGTCMEHKFRHVSKNVWGPVGARLMCWSCAVEFWKQGMVCLCARDLFVHEAMSQGQRPASNTEQAANISAAKLCHRVPVHEAPGPAS